MIAFTHFAKDGTGFNKTHFSDAMRRLLRPIPASKGYHHGASYKLVSIEQPRPYAPTGC